MDYDAFGRGLQGSQRFELAKSFRVQGARSERTGTEAQSETLRQTVLVTLSPRRGGMDGSNHWLPPTDPPAATFVKTLIRSILCIARWPTVRIGALHPRPSPARTEQTRPRSEGVLVFRDGIHEFVAGTANSSQEVSV